MISLISLMFLISTFVWVIHLVRLIEIMVYILDGTLEPVGSRIALPLANALASVNYAILHEHPSVEIQPIL